MTSQTTSGTASVTVAVAADGSIVCTPPTVDVGHFNTLISFNLVGAGFKFRATNAIVLDGTYPDFPYPSWTNSNTLATLMDKCNVANSSYKYTVYVVNIATGTEYNLDPIIHNGDPTCAP